MKDEINFTFFHMNPNAFLSFLEDNSRQSEPIIFTKDKYLRQEK